MLYKIKRYFLISLLFIPFTSISASENTIFNGEFVQGGVVIGQNKSANQVFFDGTELIVNKDGYFIFGFGRNHIKNSILKIFKKDGSTTEKLNLNIKKSIYDVEKINGLPKKMVQPGPEFYKKIKEDRLLITNSLKKVVLNNDFPSSFIAPAIGRISGIFGSQRILNGIKKNPHGGLDIAAPIGTPISSTFSGTVVLAAKGLHYNGNIVIIGHGYGLKSMYLHMEDIYVKEGDLVTQGQAIGTIGMTGRVTGPHLHWNVYLNRIKINPQLLLSLSR